VNNKQLWSTEYSVHNISRANDELGIKELHSPQVALDVDHNPLFAYLLAVGWKPGPQRGRYHPMNFLSVVHGDILAEL
jgi:hypothetical protein